jgi:hypothetical protein
VGGAAAAVGGGAVDGAAVAVGAAAAVGSSSGSGVKLFTDEEFLCIMQRPVTHLIVVVVDVGAQFSTFVAWCLESLSSMVP